MMAMVFCCAPICAQTLAPGQAPDSNPENVEEVIAESSVDPARPLLTLDRPIYRAIHNAKQKWAEQYGLELAIAYTTIAQATSIRSILRRVSW